jgi:Cdc6-like AAA superfamily ATPase
MAIPPNPFTPNAPIDPEYFAGRIGEVVKIQSALNQTMHGKTQHILLAGERGIGKTSLGLYARYIAKQPNPVLKTEFRYATAYYTVERDQSLVDVCRGLATRLLQNIDESLAKKCTDRLKKLKLHFAIHVPGLAEINVDPQALPEVESRLYADFEKAIEEAWDELKNTYNGILLVVDEIHNLGTFKGVGAFFKVVSEAWAVDGYRNAMFAVIGLPNVPTDISDDDPSAPRIFSHVELKRMTTEECLNIVRNCITKSGKSITDDAAAAIATRSGGFPYFLHQLGYDAYEQDSDEKIDMDDLNLAFSTSLTQFERMFFGGLYKSVEGRQKQKIVDALASCYSSPRTAAELARTLKIKNVHQYLKPLEKDGIVERAKSRYRLTSELLSIYVQARIGAGSDRVKLQVMSKYPLGTTESEPTPDPAASRKTRKTEPDTSEGSGE